MIHCTLLPVVLWISSPNNTIHTLVSLSLIFGGVWEQPVPLYTYVHNSMIVTFVCLVAMYYAIATVYIMYAMTSSSSM